MEQDLMGVGVQGGAAGWRSGLEERLQEEESLLEVILSHRVFIIINQR